MTDVTDRTPAGHSGSRRRGKELEQAILDATIEQLRTVGYVGLTMEGVAALAGTGKAALYRRWPNRDSLLASALSCTLPDPAAIELTGDVRKDLRAVLACIRDAIALSYGTVFQVVRSEVAQAGGLLHSVVGERVMDPCHELFLELLARGVKEGRLRAGSDSLIVAKVGPAMIVHYVVHVAPIVPDDYLDSVIDDVLVPLTAP
jgi:AcrR family transcriptional regulator